MVLVTEPDIGLGKRYTFFPVSCEIVTMCQEYVSIPLGAEWFIPIVHSRTQEIVAGLT